MTSLETGYVRLTDNESVKEPPADDRQDQKVVTATAVVEEPQVLVQPTTTYWVVSSQPAQRRKRQGCFGSLCCCLLLFVLLLFFLVPRRPEVHLDKIELSDECFESQASKCTWQGKFKFENWNYYAVHWSEFKFKLYGWSSVDNEYVFLATFKHSGEFDTSARTTSHLTAKATSTDAGNIALVEVELLMEGEETFYTKGHVNAEAGVHNWGKMQLKTNKYTYAYVVND